MKNVSSCEWNNLTGDQSKPNESSATKHHSRRPSTSPWGGRGDISAPPHVSTFLMRRHESFYPQTALGFLFSWCKQNCWLFSLSFPILTRPHYPWATHKYAVEGKVFPGDVAPEACCHSKNDCRCFHHAFVVWSCKLGLCSFFAFCCVDVT